MNLSDLLDFRMPDVDQMGVVVNALGVEQKNLHDVAGFPFRGKPGNVDNGPFRARRNQPSFIVRL